MRENSKHAPRATVLLVSLFDFYISLPSGLSIRVRSSSFGQHPPHLAVHSSLARELSAYKSARSSSFNYSLWVVDKCESSFSSAINFGVF